MTALVTSQIFDWFEWVWYSTNANNSDKLCEGVPQNESNFEYKIGQFIVRFYGEREQIILLNIFTSKVSLTFNTKNWKYISVSS